MADRIDGKSLSEMFAFVARCGSEIVSLGSTISNKVETALANSKLAYVLADKVAEVARMDESGWIYTDVAWSFPLKSRGKGNRKSQMHLIFQVSITGDGVPGVAAAPVLHVSLWEHNCDFDEDYCVGFPPEPDSAHTILCERLIVWPGATSDEAWKKFEWTFTVLLLSMNSTDELEKMIIKPALMLLQKGCTAETVEEALPNELFEQGLVRYENLEAVFGS